MFATKTVARLLLTLSLQACAATAAPTLAGLTLERNCNGCSDASRVELHADGSARLTRVGSARMGTASTTREGRLPMDAFASAARAAQAPGVAALPDDSSDPQLQDGPWLQVTLAWQDGRNRTLFYRGDTPPPALAALVEAVDAAGARVAFATP